MWRAQSQILRLVNHIYFYPNQILFKIYVSTFEKGFGWLRTVAIFFFLKLEIYYQGKSQWGTTKAYREANQHKQHKQTAKGIGGRHKNQVLASPPSTATKIKGN